MVAWLRLNGEYREKWTDSRNNEKAESLWFSKQVTGDRDTRQFCLMFFKYESSFQSFSEEIAISHSSSSLEFLIIERNMESITYVEPTKVTQLSWPIRTVHFVIVQHVFSTGLTQPLFHSWHMFIIPLSQSE